MKKITSVSDPDPCEYVLILHPRSGSVLSWISWIRIRIGNTDPNPWELKLETDDWKKQPDKTLDPDPDTVIGSNVVSGLYVVKGNTKTSIGPAQFICKGSGFFQKQSLHDIIFWFVLLYRRFRLCKPFFKIFNMAFLNDGHENAWIRIRIDLNPISPQWKHKGPCFLSWVIASKVKVLKIKKKIIFYLVYLWNKHEFLQPWTMHSLLVN